METRAHHVLIGTLTLLILAAAIGFTLWLSKNSYDKEYDLYDIVFEEAVSGLNKGGIVEFNGIRIGEVISLRFDQADAKKVIARVRVDHDAPIRSDTEAKLMSSGITGLSVIRLSSGSNTNSVLLNDDDTIPVIIASPSPLTKLLSSGEDMLTTVNGILVQTRSLLSEDNLNHVKQTLANVEKSTAIIAQKEQQIHQLIERLTQASEQANQTLMAATQLLKNSDQLVQQQGKPLLTQSHATLAQVQQSMAVAEQTLTKLNQTLSDNQNSISVGLTGMTELGPALVELKTTLASIRQISQQLENNPSNYLFQTGKVKEFQP
ncbi:MAG: MCE family protein [Gammaproteobacteria bacterium]|nr:MCE family protein [Gammaproteobacteria bacterium]